jgi:DNA-directed RNA polymerase I, II, and III subunit RPABC5|uniref:DNA-directed RNA polymerase subunit N n=1 Tax=viral metagenome TaxID=1070528 RepID=A0A6C0BGU1_9ZZZZ
MIKFDERNLSISIIEVMIIPIRCMNCGNVLADKWLFYQQKVKELRGSNEIKPIYMDGQTVPKTAELEVLNKLGLMRYCCRKHMLTHVDLIDKI